VLDDDDAVPAGKAEEQLAGLRGLLVGHASCGLVNEQEAGVLGEEHADLQPLLLAVRERAGLGVLLRGEADGLQNLPDAITLGRADAGEEGGKDAALALEREEQVLEDGVIGINGGGLEFPPDAEPVNLVLALADEIDSILAELDGADVGLGAAGDEVEERGLACAIGADDGAQLSLVHEEVEVIDGLEAVKALVDALGGQNEFLFRANHFGGMGSPVAVTGGTGSSAVAAAGGTCSDPTGA